jgi:hypothetical protein
MTRNYSTLPVFRIGPDGQHEKTGNISEFDEFARCGVEDVISMGDAGWSLAWLDKRNSKARGESQLEEERGALRFREG